MIWVESKRGGRGGVEAKRNKISLRSRWQIISLGVFTKLPLLEKRNFSGSLKWGRRKKPCNCVLLFAKPWKLIRGPRIARALSFFENWIITHSANQNIADTCWLLIQKSLEDYFFLSRLQWINVAKADFLEMLQQVIVLAFVAVLVG